MVLVSFRGAHGLFVQVDLDGNLTVEESKSILHTSHPGIGPLTRCIFKGQILHPRTRIRSIQIGPDDYIVLHSGSAPGASFPAHLEGKVTSLVALGFPRALCESALRSARGNVDKAAQNLLDGNVVTEVDRMRQLLRDQPNALEVLIRNLEAVDPAEGRQMREHPEAFLQSLGLDPGKFDLRAFRERRVEVPESAPPPPDRGELSMDDRAAVGRLAEIFAAIDPRQIEQVFVQCDRNEEAAANFLFTLM
jgi:hypothetical protein